jgi:hypothetical protein
VTSRVRPCRTNLSAREDDGSTARRVKGFFLALTYTFIRVGKFKIRFIVQRTVMPNSYDTYLRVKVRFHSLGFLDAFVRVVEAPE